MRRTWMKLCMVMVGLAASALAQAGDLTALYSGGARRVFRGPAVTLGLDRQTSAPTLALHFELQRLRNLDIPLGAVLPAGAGKLEPKPFAAGMAAGYRAEDPAFEITCGPLHPGALIKTDAAGLDFFVGLTKSKDPKRPAPNPQPEFLAFSAGGKVVVKQAVGAIPLDEMDAPWLLVWWADKAPVFDRRHGAFLNQNIVYSTPIPYDHPILIVLQNKAKSIEVAEDRLKLVSDGPAGSVVLMPLYGLVGPELVDTGETHKANWANPPVPVYKSSTEAWADGVPDNVVTLVRGWTKRMRRIPTAVKETYEVLDDGVRITEKFEYADIDDAWKTPKESWAQLPPILSLARLKGGPVHVEGKAQDLPGLGNFGTTTVADGRDSLTFTITVPQLQHYLWEMAKPVEHGEPTKKEQKIALEILREEIDKVLECNEHMATYNNLYTQTRHWGNPGETVITLCWALPYIEKDKADALKAYIAKEFKAYNPLEVSFTGAGDGVRREFYNWDPDGRMSKHPISKQQDRSRNPHNLYAVWEYVDKVAGKEALAELWPKVKAFFEADLKAAQFEWDAAESVTPQNQPQTGRFCNLNARLNGYLGAARLARLAGDKETEQLATCLFVRGLAVKHALAYYHDHVVGLKLYTGMEAPWPAGIFTDNPDFKGCKPAVLTERGINFFKMWREVDHFHLSFYDLTPEIGQFLHDYCKDPVKATVRYVMWWCPGIWSNKGDRVFAQSEYFSIEPWVPWANFLGLALAVQEKPDELFHYLGETRAKMGDLYYIQRLALTLRAFTLAGGER